MHPTKTNKFSFSFSYPRPARLDPSRTRRRWTRNQGAGDVWRVTGPVIDDRCRLTRCVDSCTCRQGYRVSRPHMGNGLVGPFLTRPVYAQLSFGRFPSLSSETSNYNLQKKMLSLPFSPASRNMFMAKLVGIGKYIPFSWESYGYLDSMPRWCKQAVTFSSTIIGGHHSNLSEGSGFSPSQRSWPVNLPICKVTPMRNKAKKWGLIEGTTMVKNPLSALKALFLMGGT